MSVCSSVGTSLAMALHRSKPDERTLASVSKRNRSPRKDAKMARLLSLNVGLPREVTWNGKTSRTAIWKFPIEGRRMARKLNIDGRWASRSR
jgi:hypothetical protein